MSNRIINLFNFTLISITSYYFYYKIKNLEEIIKNNILEINKYNDNCELLNKDDDNCELLNKDDNIYKYHYKNILFLFNRYN
jgi:hypothetical protein